MSKKNPTRRCYICIEFVLTLFQMFPMMFEHSEILCVIQGNHAFHVLAFHSGIRIQSDELFCLSHIRFF